MRHARDRALFSHAVCAAGIALLYTRIKSLSRLSPVLYLLPWAGYPVAIYMVATFEKQLSTTAYVLEHLEVMEREVTEGAEVRSVECLDDDIWAWLPWKMWR